MPARLGTDEAELCVAVIGRGERVGTDVLKQCLRLESGVLGN